MHIGKRLRVVKVEPLEEPGRSPRRREEPIQSPQEQPQRVEEPATVGK